MVCVGSRVNPVFLVKPGDDDEASSFIVKLFAPVATSTDTRTASALLSFILAFVYA